MNAIVVETVTSHSDAVSIISSIAPSHSSRSAYSGMSRSQRTAVMQNRISQLEAEVHNLTANNGRSHQEHDMSQRSALRGSVDTSQHRPSSTSARTHPTSRPAPSRPTVDIPVLMQTENGQTYQTSAVLHATGDVVYWRYTNHMFAQVQILQVFPASIVNALPRYQFKLLSNDEVFHGTHHDLFALCESPENVNHGERHRINMGDLLSPHAQIQLVSLPTHVTREQMFLWEGLRPGNFKLEKLTSALKGTTITDDSLGALRAFYDDLRLGIVACNKLSMDLLPDISRLSPSIKIRHLVEPIIEYGSYTVAMSTLSLISRFIRQIMITPSLCESAPLTKTALELAISKYEDGLDIVDATLRERIPHLGAAGFDVDSLLSKLHITNGMDYSTFIATARQVQRTLATSGITTQPNALIKKFFEQIMRCSNVAPLVFNKNHKLHQFLKSTGNNTIYTHETVDSLIEFIDSGSPPTKLILMPTEIDSSYRGLTNNRSRFSTFNKPTLATMEALHPERSVHFQDDDVPDEHQDLETSDLTFAAMRHDGRHSSNPASALKSPRTRCGACDGLHDADECHKRGPNFQPQRLRQQIEQYNLKHGDSPKKPPVDKFTPVTPTFALQQRAMIMDPTNADATQSNPDASTSQSSQPIRFNAMSVATNTEAVGSYDTLILKDSDGDVVQPKLAAMSSSQTIHESLVSLSQRIDDDLATGELHMNPQYALMSLDDLHTEHDSPGESSTSDDPHNVAQPMHVADYSVHGESLNC